MPGAGSARCPGRCGCLTGAPQVERGLEPHRGDVRGGTAADLGGEEPAQVALAHAGPGGQCRQAVVGGGVGGDLVAQGAQRGAARATRPGGHRELRLGAEPAHEHHQVARDGVGRLVALVLLDQREREVDAGGDAGGGEDAPVPDVDRVRVDGHGGEAAAQRRGVLPVRGGPAALQQPGAAERERAGADGRDPARVRGQVRDRPDERDGGPAVDEALAAGHDEGVDGPELVRAARHADPQAARGGDVLTVR